MKYLVYIPIAGHCTVEVEADDEETAIATVWESIEDYGLKDAAANAPGDAYICYNCRVVL